MDAVVKPRSVRLQIGDEQYIDVKRRLNTGERQDFFAAISLPTQAGQIPNVRTSSVVLEKVAAYLLGWSLEDDGQPLPMSPNMPHDERIAMLRSLDPDVFESMHTAVTNHEEAVEAEVEESKKSRGGAIESSVISPSHDGVTGATNGSGNLIQTSTKSSLKRSRPSPPLN